MVRRLTSFSVPEFDVSVVAAAEEASSVATEADVPHCLSMTCRQIEEREREKDQEARQGRVKGGYRERN